MQACDRCHARKTKCDRRIPRCGGCEKAGVPCLHIDKLRSRNLPRAYVEEIENSMRRVQEQNSQLKHQLAQLRSPKPASNGGFGGSNGRSDDCGPQYDKDVTVEQDVEEVVTHPLTPSPLQDSPYQHSRHPDNARVPPAPTVTSGRTPTDDAVASEVGYLTLSATGETRFLGSSSGIGLANIISSVLDPQHASSNWPKDDNRNQEGHECEASTSLGDAQLLPRSMAMQFINAYFQHTHITFPLLHRPSFLAAVEQIYNHPTYYTTYAFDAFVFDMVLSIGSSNFNRFQELANGAASHYTRALTRMQTILNMRGLVPLQAILLLCQHSVFSNMRNTSASIWHLIGIGARMCLELGLHLEPRRTFQTEPGVASNIPVAFETEMRKRTFWCFYNLDRVVSFTLGRPVALRDDDIDISLPSPLDDDAFGPDRPIQPQPLSNARQSSPFLHLIAIRRLSGQILSTLYAPRQKLDISLEEKVRVRQQFYKEVIAWKDATASLQLEAHSQNDQRHISCFLTPIWYEAVASNALLLLYRPSPYLPCPVVPTKAGGEPGDLQRLVSAARSSITSYSDLHRRRRLNYSWITLHGIFIAGLTYIYGIGLGLKDLSHGMVIPDYLQIIDDTRACSNILIAICERWSVARRSCDIFNGLSSAVIKDAIEASARRKTLLPDQRQFGANSSTHQDDNLALSMQLTYANDIETAQPLVQNPSDLGCTTLAPSNQFSNMYVEDEFKQYLNGLDHLFFGNQLLPNEFMEGFSQDGLFADL